MLIMPSVTMNGGSPPQLTSAPLRRPHGDADGQRQRQRDRQRLPALQRRAEHDSRQRDDRPDREIDAAGEDHERHARRRRWR